MSEQAFTPAPTKERHEFPALSKRKAKPRALPGSRRLREPNGPCRLCCEPATRFKSDIPLCDGHFTTVNDLINHREPAASERLIAEADEARAETGSLRDRLRARHAHRWTDRPIVDWFPVLAE